jgi:hypothetical protein
MGKQVVLTGRLPGTRLTVLSKERRTPSGVFWKVQCDCGNIRFVRTTRLLSGAHKSCGCLRAERLVEHNAACRVPVVEGRRRCSKCKDRKLVIHFNRSTKTTSGFQTHCKDCNLIYEWQRKYSLTEEEARYLVQLRAKSVCGGCGKKDGLDLDHNHETMEIRGFLCGPCNRALGLLRENPEILIALYNYIIGSKDNDNRPSGAGPFHRILVPPVSHDFAREGMGE